MVVVVTVGAFISNEVVTVVDVTVVEVRVVEVIVVPGTVVVTV